MTPIRRRLFLGLVTVLALTAVIHVGLFFVEFGSLAADLGVAAWLVIATLSLTNATAVAACVLALALAWRAGNREDARALALFLVFLAHFWGWIFRFVSFEYDAVGGSLNFEMTMGRGLVQLAYGALLLAIAAFLRFSILFPRRVTREAIAAGRGARPMKFLRVLCLRPSVVWGGAIAVIGLLVIPQLGRSSLPAAAGGLEEIFNVWGLRGVLSYAVLIVIYAVLPVALIALGTMNLWQGHRSSRGEERRKSTWVVAGFVTAAWMVLIPFTLFFIPLPGFLSFLEVTLVLLLLAPSVLLIFLAIGIFDAGAIDPALVLRRSTVLGFFSGLLIIGGSLIESVASELIEARFAGMGDMAGAVLAGLLVALVLVPFRGRILRTVEGWASRAAGNDLVSPRRIAAE